MLSTSIGLRTELLATHAENRENEPTENVSRLASAPSVPPRIPAITEKTGEAEIVLSKGGALQDREFRTVTVPLRLEGFEGRIRTIQIAVTDLDNATEQVCLGGQTIGFISRAGRIFVALSGTRRDRAEECGQCLLWDEAATILVTGLGRQPEPTEPDPARIFPGRTTNQHAGDAGQPRLRQPSRRQRGEIEYD
ncbi:hypothetical protein [Subtercola boreus]|uniref:hypothetical protein n=1 Tax=Subtercola boreus TaxID=120213 RepID=UPI0011C05B92|nr:hypothetical protein [Subtercola boreus]